MLWRLSIGAKQRATLTSQLRLAKFIRWWKHVRTQWLNLTKMIDRSLFLENWCSTMRRFKSFSSYTFLQVTWLLKDFFQQLHPPWDVLQTSGDHWSKPRITTATLSQPWPKTTSKPNNKTKCQIFWCCFATLPERSIVCLSAFQIIYFDLTSAISETTQNQGNKSTLKIGTLDLHLEP
jgi:hypothetical protein